MKIVLLLPLFIALTNAYGQSSEEDDQNDIKMFDADGQSLEVADKNLCLNKHQIPELDYSFRVVEKYFGQMNWQNFGIIPEAISINNTGLTLIMKFSYSNDKDEPTISDGALAGKGVYKLDHLYLYYQENNPWEWDYEDLSFPAELHMVFYSTAHGTFERAQTEKYGLAILSTGFRISAEPEYDTFTILAEYMKNIIEPDSTVSVKDADLFPLERLGSVDLNDFYMYNGTYKSAPDCIEDVIWIDFVQPHQITPRQAEEYLKPLGVLGLSLTHHVHHNYYRHPRYFVYKSINSSSEIIAAQDNFFNFFYISMFLVLFFL